MAEKNPLIEVNRRAMEHIWSKVPKEIKNGVEYVTYIETDLPYLYYSGLVDTARYTLDQWLKAFEDSKGEDGRYWVSHEKMLSLGMFRYCKVVNEPFDPMKMRVGKYSVDRLWKVFETSIMPSCSLPQEFMKNTFDNMFRRHKKPSEMWGKGLKLAKEKGDNIKEGDLDQGLPAIETIGKENFIEVTRDQLARLKTFLDSYPSPRRKLEVGVHENRLNKLQQLADVAKTPQKSSFESGKDFRETAKKDLKSLLVKASESTSGGRKPKGEAIDLKSLQNKRPTKF